MCNPLLNPDGSAQQLRESLSSTLKSLRWKSLTWPFLPPSPPAWWPDDLRPPLLFSSEWGGRQARQTLLTGWGRGPRGRRRRCSRWSRPPASLHEKQKHTVQQDWWINEQTYPFIRRLDWTGRCHVSTDILYQTECYSLAKSRNCYQKELLYINHPRTGYFFVLCFKSFYKNRIQSFGYFHTLKNKLILLNIKRI